MLSPEFAASTDWGLRPSTDKQIKLVTNFSGD